MAVNLAADSLRLKVLGLFALAGVVVGVLLLGAVWAYLPSPAQKLAKRAELEELQGKVDQLHQRGGALNVRRCGAREQQLCVEVDAGAKMFHAGDALFIVSKTY